MLDVDGERPVHRAKVENLLARRDADGRQLGLLEGGEEDRLELVVSHAGFVHLSAACCQEPNIVAGARPHRTPRLLRGYYAGQRALCARRLDDGVRGWLGFERYGLKLHPDKTRLLPFRRPNSDQREGTGPTTFDFLGFTVHWARSRKGRWVPSFKTRTVRLRRAITAVADGCRRHRHRPVKEQHAALRQRLNGHFDYFGVNGDLRSLERLAEQAKRLWKKWLSRRSQRAFITRERFKELLRDYPMPIPRIRVQIWRPAR